MKQILWQSYNCMNKPMHSHHTLSETTLTATTAATTTTTGDDSDSCKICL